MAGGPLLPSSVYTGGASGYVTPSVYIPATNPNNAGAIEGLGVVASLSVDAPAVLQFNMPETIPSGTCKLRILAWANATAGVAKLTISDGATSTGSNIGVTTLTAETQISQTWTTADVMVLVGGAALTLTTVPTANQMLTILATFNMTSWTLAQNSVWQFSIVWE